MTLHRQQRLNLAAEQIDALLSIDEHLVAIDRTWTALGYGRRQARLHRRGDGTYTARIVWRKTKALVSTVTITVRGIRLA